MFTVKLTKTQRERISKGFAALEYFAECSDLSIVAMIRSAYKSETTGPDKCSADMARGLMLSWLSAALDASSPSVAYLFGLRPAARDMRILGAHLNASPGRKLDDATFRAIIDGATAYETARDAARKPLVLE